MFTFKHVQRTASRLANKKKNRENLKNFYRPKIFFIDLTTVLSGTSWESQTLLLKIPLNDIPKAWLIYWLIPQTSVHKHVNTANVCILPLALKYSKPTRAYFCTVTRILSLSWRTCFQQKRAELLIWHGYGLKPVCSFFFFSHMASLHLLLLTTQHS